MNKADYPIHQQDFSGILAYKNDNLIKLYAVRESIALSDAAHLFEECKKFLALISIIPQPISPSKQLDSMWHHFILHTHDYAAFCEKFFGKFLHHHPTNQPYTESRGEMLQLAKTIFGDIDPVIWPTTEVIACDSSCGGDSYCKGD
ncbi:MAG: hypothetical protein COU90_03555 [Candidatus Ryanbacteria bacterium CG10_big_fil_rev_8_21_14_0_10_43_42]|uniref:Uncharacterized protein n=1 Tax=Candidatus Ryanbacteria bacterium CG10_big_fil_rev_8_21_14_0_10_43_42 TaxID=1974864 RepID=A0A2M8KWH0_9BACT|nr:MAG: hypothetical protein COU90_03555 [Candidatus Ryanbacteria bacterium CG10_big_fil_rev_8_21_14_0_10_43_42]